MNYFFFFFAFFTIHTWLCPKKLSKLKPITQMAPNQLKWKLCQHRSAFCFVDFVANRLGSRLAEINKTKLFNEKIEWKWSFFRKSIPWDLICKINERISPHLCRTDLCLFWILRRAENFSQFSTDFISKTITKIIFTKNLWKWVKIKTLAKLIFNTTLISR